MDIEELIAVSGGIKYDLNTSKIVLRSHVGLGIADIQRTFQRSPLQAGVTAVSFVERQREFALSWALVGGNSSDVWNLRTELLGVLRARTADPIQFIFQLANGERRAIDADLQGAIPMSTDGRGKKSQTVSAAFLAPSPYLYDPKVKQKIITAGTPSSGWEIEEDGVSSSDGWNIEETGATTSDGWTIGITSFSNQSTISYANLHVWAAPEYPVMRLTGPIESPVITNVTNSESLDFSGNGGLFIEDGDYIDIDLRFRAGKTAQDSSGNSVESYLTDDSDLATWHLSYNTELLADGSRSTGVNTIKLEGDGITASTQLQIDYYHKYIGI